MVVAVGPGAATEASVTIGYHPGSVTVEVADRGTGASRGTVNGTGHGLIGMRERVAVFGGEFTAGPGADGGFRVRARFPVTEVRS